MRRLLASVALGFALVTPQLARGEGTPLRADQMEAKGIRLDGVLKEWTQLTHLDHTLKGSPSRTDCDARAAIAYDGANIYVAADVSDDDLKGGGDRVVVVIGFPGGVTHEVEIFPGEPGKSAGSVKRKGGGGVPGAKVVEAPREGGWTLEASIPWSTFPESRLVRVGMRGGIFVHDADGGTSVKNVVGTASSTAYAALPALSTESEQALSDGLLHDKGLYAAPRCNLVANVVGDATKERVLVFDKYLVVLGPNYRKGSEYYYTDLDAEILGCEAKDVTGDGLADVILRKRIGTGSRTRDTLLVMSFGGGGDTPTAVFQHEFAISTDAGSVTNDVAFQPDGGKFAIKISAGRSTGLSAANFREPMESSWDPVLLPWSTVASQTWRFSGGKFEKADEVKQAGVAAPARSAASHGPSGGGETGLPKAPPPPSAAELQNQVYEAYKRDRGASGHPRFDLAIDVAGDPRPERVLLHDRDIVLFGKGFKNGTGYAYLTLTQFTSPSDILEVTARDVTGDGKAEILVRGVQHGPAPANAGGGTIDREVLIVFTVAGDQIRRVFAAETGRALGHKRVAGAITLRAGEIVLSPGRATEWTQATYPFSQDTSPVGGYEPLLLPWGGAQPVRYRWGSGGFSR